MRRANAIVAAALACALAACGPNIAQAPSPEEATKTPYGSWTLVKTSRGDREGELLAVSEKQIFLRTRAGIIAIPHDQVSGITLWRFDPSSTGLVTASLLGTLSTLTHGYFLLLTAPAWGLFGALTAITEETSGELEDPSLGELRKWARFPQGMPAAFATKHGLRTGDPWKPGSSQEGAPSPWDERPPGWQPADAGARDAGPAPAGRDAGAEVP